jgi:hypothetical protein
MTTAGVAKAFKRKRRGIMAKLSGHRGMTTDEISRMALLLWVHPRWVLTGEGPLPPRIARALEAEGTIDYIDLAGVHHPRAPLTELVFCMGPYMTREQIANDRSDLIGNYEYVRRYHPPELARAVAKAVKERPARSIPAKGGKTEIDRTGDERAQGAG